MSEIDFQNGLAVGLTLAGKNGVIGGVKQTSSSPTDCLLGAALLSGFSYAWDWASKVITGSPLPMILTELEAPS